VALVNQPSAKIESRLTALSSIRLIACSVEKPTGARVRVRSSTQIGLNRVVRIGRIADPFQLRSGVGKSAVQGVLDARQPRLATLPTGEKLVDRRFGPRQPREHLHPRRDAAQRRVALESAFADRHDDTLRQVDRMPMRKRRTVVRPGCMRACDTQTKRQLRRHETRPTPRSRIENAHFGFCFCVAHAGATHACARAPICTCEVHPWHLLRGDRGSLRLTGCHRRRERRRARPSRFRVTERTHRGCESLAEVEFPNPGITHADAVRLAAQTSAEAGASRRRQRLELEVSSHAVPPWNCLATTNNVAGPRSAGTRYPAVESQWGQHRQRRHSGSHRTPGTSRFRAWNRPRQNGALERWKP